MPEDQTDPTQSGAASGQFHLKVPALVVTLTAITALTLAGIGARLAYRGDFNLIYTLLILFFAINLVICYWELCLLIKRDYIERRAEHWKRRWEETGRAPPVEFLSQAVSLKKWLSLTVWADVWASYCHVDSSYADRRTYGYSVDVGNGFVTPVPMLILFAAYTFELLSATVSGIIGAMLFWQLLYATSVYWFSFFIAKRHTRISRRDLYIYIFTLNSPWILFALLGLYVSVRLILENSYAVLGH